jgi:two-component system response regulator NreC
LEPKKTIRVLVADHQLLFRQGLLTLIGSEKDLEVVGSAENFGQIALELARTTPDVAIVACDLPGLDGFAAFETLRRGGTQLLALSNGTGSHLGPEPELPSVPRDEAFKLALPLIRQMAAQSCTLSLQNLVAKVNQLRSMPTPAAHSGPTLTARENEILRLLAEGHTVKDAATELNLSVKTVEAHKFNLMRKLNLHTTSEVVAYANSHSLLAQPVIA